MSATIEKLLSLVDEFPKRVRIDYDENADRAFCNSILTALKEAAPDIRQLTSPSVPRVSVNPPSTSFESTPAPANNIHSPNLSQGIEPQIQRPVVEVDGTVVGAGRIQDTSGIPTPAAAILEAARKNAATPPSPEPTVGIPATTKEDGRVRRRGKFSTPKGGNA